MNNIPNVLLIVGTDKVFLQVSSVLDTLGTAINITRVCNDGELETQAINGSFGIVISCLDNISAHYDHIRKLLNIFATSKIVIVPDNVSTQEIVKCIHLGIHSVVPFNEISDLNEVVKNIIASLEQHSNKDICRILDPTVFKFIFENVAQIAVQGYDMQGRLTYWNKGSHNLYGHTSDEVIGKKISEIRQTGIQPNGAIDDILANFNNNAQMKIEDMVFKRKDNQNNLSWSYFTLLEDQLGEREIFCIDVDQLFQKRMQNKIDKQKAYLESLFNSSPLAIGLVDKNNHLIDCNQYFEEMFGYARSELLGYCIDDFIVPEGLKHEVGVLARKAELGDMSHLETRRVAKSGEVIDVLIIVKAVILYGKVISKFAIYQDISERNELLKKLTIAKETAEASDNLKTLFINSISHEIRTPVNGILGYASLLNNSELSESQRAKNFEMIQLSCDRLLNTATNYIDILLLTSNNINPVIKEVVVGSLLFDIYEAYYDIIDAKGIAFSLQLPDDIDNYSLYTDADLLVKVLRHILDNAVRYTSSGIITIGLDIDKTSLRIFVEDTGKGMSEDSIEKIYQPFVDINISRQFEYEGDGLSLSLVVGIAKLLGGKIEVKSVEGEGTRFDIVFMHNRVITAQKLGFM